MASKVFLSFMNTALTLAMVTTKDIRVALCMNNTTCATDALTTKASLSVITTLDECDDTGSYARVALTTEGSAVDDPNDRVEFTDLGAATVVFSGLNGDASRAYKGVLVYEYVDGTAANDKPQIWVEFPATIPATSTKVTVTWNAEGIVQASNA